MIKVTFYAGADCILGSLGSSAESVISYAQKIENDRGAIDFIVDEITSYEQKLNDFMQKLKSNLNVDKIILAIDNLDRCDPDRALVFLEKIKIFLYNKDIIPIIAFDEMVLANALIRRYSNLTISSAYEYINKLVIYKIRVPEIGKKDFMKYLRVLSNSYDVNDYFPDNFLEHYVPAIIGGRLHNPRKYHKIMKDIQLYKHFQQMGLLAYKPNNSDVVCVITLREFWPELYLDLLGFRRLLIYLLAVAQADIRKRDNFKLGIEKKYISNEPLLELIRRYHISQETRILDYDEDNLNKIIENIERINLLSNQ